MIRAILIGLVAGQRAMTPLAVVAGAAREGRLPPGAGAAALAHPAVATAAVALAAAEMAGDKLPSAPDRIILPGLIARAATAAFAGSVLERVPERRRLAAGLAGGVAIASAYAGWSLRRRAMRRWGQARTGFVEDALVLGAGLAATRRRD